MKKLITAIIAIATLSTVISAEDIQKHQIFLGSYHTVEKATGEWNQFNYGYSYTFDNTIKVGAYQNSFNRPTVFIGKDLPINNNVGFFLAAGTGYNSKIGGSLYVKTENIRVDILPLVMKEKNDGQKIGAVLAVSFVF